MQIAFLCCPRPIFTQRGCTYNLVEIAEYGLFQTIFRGIGWFSPAQQRNNRFKSSKLVGTRTPYVHMAPILKMVYVASLRGILCTSSRCPKPHHARKGIKWFQKQSRPVHHCVNNKHANLFSERLAFVEMPCEM